MNVNCQKFITYEGSSFAYQLISYSSTFVNGLTSSNRQIDMMYMQSWTWRKIERERERNRGEEMRDEMIHKLRISAPRTHTTTTSTAIHSFCEKIIN